MRRNSCRFAVDWGGKASRAYCAASLARRIRICLSGISAGGDAGEDRCRNQAFFLIGHRVAARLRFIRGLIKIAPKRLANALWVLGRESILLLALG